MREEKSETREHWVCTKRGNVKVSADGVRFSSRGSKCGPKVNGRGIILHKTWQRKSFVHLYKGGRVSGQRPDPTIAMVGIPLYSQERRKGSSDFTFV